MFSWLIDHWSGLLSDIGIIAGLLFSGLGFWNDVRVRRAQTSMDIYKLHRDLWMYFDDHAELHGLFDEERDMAVRPLTAKEAHFVSFLLNHIRATFYDRKAGIYAQPECFEKDVREVFSYPAFRFAWSKAKKYHDAKFVALIDGAIS